MSMSGKVFRKLAEDRGCRYSDMDSYMDFPEGTYSKFARGKRIPNLKQLMIMDLKTLFDAPTYLEYLLSLARNDD